MQPTPNSRSVSKRFFDWLQKNFGGWKNPESPSQKLVQRFRAGLTIVTAGCFLFLAGMILLLNWWGERHWLLSVWLFVPAILWLVPFILLTPFHLLIRPKLCWISAAALLLIGFVYLDFHCAFSTIDSKSGLTLLTNNVGGRKFHTLADFVKKENPDVIALQDSAQFIGLAKRYPERFVSTLGEYILVSKIPIRKSGMLFNLTYHGRPIAAWHELHYEDQSIVIYNVHMPTPRMEFARLRGRGFLPELFGGKGIYSSEVRKEYQEFIADKTRLTRGLAEVLKKEKRPFLIAGDFNMPSHGYLYDLFSSNLNDAFRQRGRGYGFTFPGAINSWLKVFGSWLRLDYVFAGQDWQVNWCRVEPRGVSEHQAVVAQLELKSHKP